jgi:hypothetical protein
MPWNGWAEQDLRTGPSAGNLLVYLPIVPEQVTWSYYAPPCSLDNDYCEDNDTHLTAYGPLEPDVAYQAYPEDREDYYYFRLSARATVNIHVTNFAPTSSYGDLYLYGPASGTERGDRIDYYGRPGHSSMSLGPHSLEPGKYYVRVYATRTDSKLYDLGVTYEVP